MKHCASYSARTTGLEPRFRDFFETFFKVPGAPPGRPYVRFTEASDANLWLNSNVAGSYAPSSVRNDNPFRQVVKIGTGRNAKYSLVPQHAQRALKLLANNTPIPSLPLAVFLYREHALLTENPDLTQWVDIFREEFGYPHTVAGDAEFATLYSDADSITHGKHWLVDVQ